MKYVLRSHDAFISKPDICFPDSISFVVIGSMSSFWNRKNEYSLSIFMFSGEDETRNRGYPFFDKSAYVLCILLRVCHYGNYRHQRRENHQLCLNDTIEPALRLFI